MFNFEKLLAYQETKRLVTNVFSIADKMTSDDVLKYQIKKSVIAVPSTIAEGMSHATNEEKIQYLDIAYCLLAKVYTQLQLAYDLRYITNGDMEYISNEMQEAGKIVLGLKRKLRGDVYIPREDNYSRDDATI